MSFSLTLILFQPCTRPLPVAHSFPVPELFLVPTLHVFLIIVTLNVTASVGVMVLSKTPGTLDGHGAVTTLLTDHTIPSRNGQLSSPSLHEETQPPGRSHSQLQGATRSRTVEGTWKWCLIRVSRGRPGFYLPREPLRTQEASTEAGQTAF